jgi:hypothetical protein
VGVEAKPALRLVGTVHAIAIKLAQDDATQVAVPDTFDPFRQRDPLKLAVALAVEETQLDLGGNCGKQRKIRAGAVPGSAERNPADALMDLLDNEGS